MSTVSATKKMEWELTQPPIYHPHDWSQICKKPEDMCMGTWGWMRIHDIFECLKHRQRTMDLPGLAQRPQEIWRRYGLLCNRREFTALFTWGIHSSYERDSEIPPPRDQAWFVHIPAGWGRRILKAAEASILDVSVAVHLIDGVTAASQGLMGPVPLHRKYSLLHGPFVKYQLIGHKADGTQTVVLFNGEGGVTTPEAPSLTFLD